MYNKIIQGIETGLAYALAGKLKSDKLKGTKFNPIKVDYYKLSKTVVICTIVGAISGYYNKDMTLLMTGSIGIAVTNLVNMFWKSHKDRIMLIGRRIFLRA